MREFTGLPSKMNAEKSTANDIENSEEDKHMKKVQSEIWKVRHLRHSVTGPWEFIGLPSVMSVERSKTKGIKDPADKQVFVKDGRTQPGYNIHKMSKLYYACTEACRYW